MSECKYQHPKKIKGKSGNCTPVQIKNAMETQKK